MDRPQDADVTQSTIIKALGWAYDAAMKKWPTLDSAHELAKEYLSQEGTRREQVESLINWHITEAAVSSFATGLGGVLALAITVPADLASTYYIQMRMVLAIACMGGKPLRSERVRTLSYLCLCGEAATDIASDLGIKLGERLSERAIRALSTELAEEITERVGARLLAKLSSEGFAHLVPLLGGPIGALVSGVATNEIGHVARNMFIDA